MKKIIVISMMALVFGCGPNNYSDSTVQVNPASSTLGDNLDLQALGELVKTSANAADLEQALNKDGSINNIDLDGDGKVDYITVTEYPVNDQSKGFSFTIDLGDKGKQEIATVEIQKNTNSTASMNISGNQTIYGSNAVYSSNYSMADLMIMSWLWSPHSIYYSPYHYGYYPSYYHYGYCSPYNSYHSRMYSNYGSRSTIKRTTTTTTRVSKSPYSSSSSSFVSTRSKSLSNPTSSQRSFSARSSNATTPSTNGFKSSGSSYKSSSSYSSPSRSSSSSRSFGSSSRSSSSRGGRR